MRDLTVGGVSALLRRREVPMSLFHFRHLLRLGLITYTLCSLSAVLTAQQVAASAIANTEATASPVQTTFVKALLSQAGLANLRKSLVFTGVADWTAGSTHDSGQASLTANTNGSHRVLLGLSTNAQAFDVPAPQTSHSCVWIDGKGASHAIDSSNCASPLPWFAPLLGPSLMASAMATVSDDGEIVDNGVMLHSLTFRRPTTDNSSVMARFVEATKITVLYNPDTFAPVVALFSAHPDGDLSRDIPVRIDYSDFRTVAGLLVPYHINKYFNRTLQLSIQANTVSVQ